jgi:hypothetical protein
VLETRLRDERAQAESRLSKLRAELSAVRSEAAARMRDLQGQVRSARVCNQEGYEEGDRLSGPSPWITFGCWCAGG